MSRVASWNPAKFDDLFANATMDTLRAGALIVANNVRARCPGFPSTVSRPVYRSGPYAGMPWTARDAGQLKRSIRVVEKYPVQVGFSIAEFQNVRVYAGHYLAYYARIVEFYTPYMRPGLTASLGDLKALVASPKKVA